MIEYYYRLKKNFYLYRRSPNLSSGDLKLYPVAISFVFFLYALTESIISRHPLHLEVQALAVSVEIPERWWSFKGVNRAKTVTPERPRG